MERKQTTNNSTRAFTLTEMLIAVAILAIVILATSTIFGTAQRVSSVAEANADLVQQASAIERRVRRDIEQMSNDGFLAIQCVAVRNDVNFGQTGRLLDDARLAGDELRCDQLVFFSNGVEPTSRFLGSYNSSFDTATTLAPAEAPVAMIYLGHGVQMPVQPAQPAGSNSNFWLWDFDRAAAGPPYNQGVYHVFPWTFQTGFPTFCLDSGVSQDADVPVISPPANRWVLSRRPVLLTTDDLVGVLAGDPEGDYDSVLYSTDFFGMDQKFANSETSLFIKNENGFPKRPLEFTHGIASGRVDIASSELDDIQRQVGIPWNELNGLQTESDNILSPLVRNTELLDAIFSAYPRAERIAPSMSNIDQMLSNNVLSGSVSDFQVDWIWEDGLGRDLDAKDDFFTGGLPGVPADAVVGEWYGLDFSADSAPYLSLPENCQPVWSALNEGPGDYPNNIERYGAALEAPDGVRRYGAVFGLNRDRGFLRGSDDRPLLTRDGGFNALQFYDTMGTNNTGNIPRYVNTYSPWPTAIRITMRLHDANDVIRGGRLFQFVVPLPKQD